ncbi:DUF4214 domain-containing protein [Roseomonas sp. KE2513]|uniref:DUF4214 domain-containing protein n=1 Tax=Roseomonas sp. KE2513 TaxID=2479202 RepID=UPI0018E01590|nr:DUF4214 domain-containing protein [Roseomonas sp. KE2513]MBI0534663.1 DUF4214 domain-containing protein [Roseomonas sp. KE2513]
MIRGHLDALTPLGFVEGWCFDDEEPDRTLPVLVRSPEGEELAAGHANLFRADLAHVRFGHGWCAFRLRLSLPVEEAAATPLELSVPGNGREIEAPRVLPIRAGAEPSCNTIAKVIAADPTVTGAIEQLRAYGPVLEDFMTRRGIDDFIHTAYVYVLGRPVDLDGLAIYGPLLEMGALSPYGLLALLAASDEFHARPRFLAAPNSPAFVFRRS